MKLDNALQRIATIHQQHSIKCYLAIKSLKQKFDWPEQDWSQLIALINLQEPVFTQPILTTNSAPFNIVPRRRHWILSHAIYPHAYFTMLDWFNETDIDEIFQYYLVQCAESNEYLSHNISILLAFKNTWPEIETQGQRLRFIERFCEFITSTFYGNNHQAYSINPDRHSACNEDCFEGGKEVEKVFKNALSHPGFWGHNLISLASLLKYRQQLEPTLFTQLLNHINVQCHWEFDDELDNPQIEKGAVAAYSHEVLEANCRCLLFDKNNNLHQITLADTVTYFCHQPWVTDTNKVRLIDIMLHFSRATR